MTMNLLNLTLTEDEEAIFFGSLLGDGHLQKRGTSFRAKIEHCFKHKEYVLWKYEKLKRLCDNNHSPQLASNLKNNQSYFFYLQSGHYLEKYHNLFYQPYFWEGKVKTQSHQKKSPVKKTQASKVLDTTGNFELLPEFTSSVLGFCDFQLTETKDVSSLKTKTPTTKKIRYKKVITETLIKSLPKNPLVLAVWFLDDGSCRKDVFSGRLATQAFSKEEQKLLQDYLKTVFDINTQLVLYNRLKNQYYLSIPAKNQQFSKFVDLIQPSIGEILCMKYKTLNPRKA